MLGRSQDKGGVSRPLEHSRIGCRGNGKRQVLGSQLDVPIEEIYTSEEICLREIEQLLRSVTTTEKEKTGQKIAIRTLLEHRFFGQ